ncbi:hypothetical protein [Thalassoglobus sp.]|uniref:hypothetical protein n=1 Tax=Thalassoglobus sp. TaxID=2795869 RepID=UPI003AA9A158
MFIIAQGGKTYAELSWRHGGPAALRMNVEIDYSQPFASSDQHTWNAEYRSCVHKQHALNPHDFDEWEEWLSDNGDASELNRDRARDFSTQKSTTNPS